MVTRATYLVLLVFELCRGCIAPPTFQEHPEGISNYYGKIDIAKGVFGVVGEDGRGWGARV